jgi:hypothetical protein
MRADLPPDLSLEIIDSFSILELQEIISRVDDQTTVFWTVVNQDSLGQRYDYRESLDLMGRVNAPIFSVWPFYFGQGQVGGKTH